MIVDTPESRLGAIKSVDDIKPHQQLAASRTEFETSDLGWDHYVEVDGPKSSSRCVYGRRHLAEIADRHDDHPALISVETAVAFADYLWIERDMTDLTAKTYWDVIYRWYHWMLWRTDYPHTYNPLLLAAVEDQTSRRAFRLYTTEKADVPPQETDA